MTSGCRSSLPASVAWTPWTIRRPDLWPSRISAPSQELAGEASGACAKSFRDVSNADERRRGDTACPEKGFPKPEKELARTV